MATSANMGNKPHPSCLNGDTALSVHFQNFLKANNVFEDQLVLDIGFGKGFMLKCAIECKAAAVCGIDISESDVKRCEETFQKDSNVHVALINAEDVTATSDFVKARMGKPATVILCNPAQIPLLEPLPNGYFLGRDGRGMIDSVLKCLKQSLRTKLSVCYMAHTMLSCPMRTVEQCIEIGLRAEILEGSVFEFEVYESLRDDEELLNYWKQEFGFCGMIECCIMKVTKAEYREMTPPDDTKCSTSAMETSPSTITGLAKKVAAI